MTNAIVPMNEIQAMAEAVASSGLFGVKTPAQALSLMLIAQAEGRHPALAARDYDIIQGRPAKKTEAMLRDFLQQDGKVEWHALDDTIADATFSHPAGGSVRIAWDMKRVAKAKISNAAMYEKYPRAMLRSRTVSEGIRTVCPMATSGMYVPEEIHGFGSAKDITPSAGVEDQLDNAQIVGVKNIAVKMQEHLAQGDVGEAVKAITSQGTLTAEEEIYLWTHFDSKQRSAMKKEQARMRAPKLPAPTPVGELISEAQKKRLEARIGELKIDREAVKKYVKDTFGKDHFADLSKDEYAKLDAMIDRKAEQGKSELEQPTQEEV
jgi:hypothetical protein